MKELIGKKSYFIIVFLVTYGLIGICNGQSCPSSGPDFMTNYISNGDFQDPVVGAPTQYAGGINGWAATLAEIGPGSYYNTNWGATQVIHLDTTLNQNYTQSFPMPADK